MEMLGFSRLFWSFFLVPFSQFGRETFPFEVMCCPWWWWGCPRLALGLTLSWLITFMEEEKGSIRRSGTTITTRGIAVDNYVGGASKPQHINERMARRDVRAPQ